MKIFKAVRAIFCTGLALYLCTAVPCLAETTNDFKALYDEELKEGLLELWQAYGQVTGQVEEMRGKVISQEHYNSMIGQAAIWQETRCKELDSEVEGLLEEQRCMLTDFCDGFYGDFAELVSLDAAYKANRKKLESLLVERNRHTAFTLSEIDYNTLACLEQEAIDLGKAYVESIDVVELGEVYGVHFPLEKESEIRSAYGIRLDPMNPVTTRFHAGVDLKAAEGTPVLSIFHGTVAEAGWGPIGGYYVRIDHGDGIGSYYCHLSKLLCSKGQRVSQYDTIALSGNTGSRTTGPHLHFALYIDGVSVDPAVLFCKE